MGAEPQAPAAPPPAAVPRWRRALRALGRGLAWVAAALLIAYAVGRLRGPSLAVAPELDLPDLHAPGAPRVTLASLRGQPVVLNFWASWCGPCRVELPALGRFARSHPEIRVVGVSHDDADALLEAARDARADFPLLHDAGGGVSRAYGVTTLPTTVALDASGAVVWTYSGILLDPHLVWLGLTL